MEKEKEDSKLLRFGGESAEVDLSRTAFRIVQVRDDSEMKEGRREEESKDSEEDGFRAGELKPEGRETGDGEEEETMEGERDEVNEEVNGADCDHLEEEKEGDPALFEEDEMEDMFRSSNLIIIPFPRQDRNCSTQNSDSDINDKNSDPDVNEDAAVQEEREEAQSDNSSRIEEELEENENKDPDEENSDKSDQVQLRICFPPICHVYCISQASDLSRQLVDVGRQLKSWRRSLNHCQPSKLRALVHRCTHSLNNSLGPLTCSLPDRCPQIA